MFDGINRLSLQNFRSYRFLDLPIASQFVVLTGENGAGKTNILEAISLLSSTSGLRKAGLKDILFNGASSFAGWRIRADIVHRGDEVSLETYWNRDKRYGRIDSAPVTSLKRFEELVWLLWITPHIDSVLSEQPHIKRKFFDHLVSGLYPGHYTNLKQVGKLQKERLHILMNNPNKNWIAVIEKQLLPLYISIYNARKRFLELLNDELHTHYSDMLKPNISCDGSLERSLTDLDDTEFEHIILSAMESCRNDDSIKGVTNYSVLRTNWMVYKNDQLSVEHCSSGEQKSMLIVLIFAVLRIYQRTRSGIPILLLDDFMVHLDNNKRSLFIRELEKISAQVFLTGTDNSFFEGFQNNAQFINVRNSICF